MGKASRWFRSLFGFRLQDNKKQQQQQQQPPQSTGWRFGKSRRESHVNADDKHVPVGVDPKKHAIVTEGIAKAAVSTAKATVARISLTNRGMLTAGAPPRNNGIVLGIRECAAVKIQSHFRSYLAKRALRALKGLVKLQALVRGYIIRKQTAEMLSQFQSLLRAQARAKLSRAQASHLPHCSVAKLAQTKSGPLLRRNGSKSNVRRASDLDNMLHHKKWNNNNIISLSFSTSNDSTGQDHLVPSPSSYEIQSVVNFKTKESTPFCTPSNSPMMMCYSSSDYGNFDNYPSYMAYTESSKAKMRSFSAPKQRINNQFERMGSIKRHLAYNGTSPSSHTNFSNKAYTSSGRLDRVGAPVLLFDSDLLRK